MRVFASRLKEFGNPSGEMFPLHLSEHGNVLRERRTVFDAETTQSKHRFPMFQLHAELGLPDTGTGFWRRMWADIISSSVIFALVQTAVPE